jgi:hypothetical protein
VLTGLDGGLLGARPGAIPMIATRLLKMDRRVDFRLCTDREMELSSLAFFRSDDCDDRMLADFF